MKSRNLLGLCSLLALFSACGNGAPKYDATGTFETTEVLVSAEASGRLLYFDIEEGMLLKAGEEVGVVDTVQLYLKKLQLEASLKSVEEQRPDILKQVAATKEQISAAQRERNRVANLLKVGAANQKQLDDAERATYRYGGSVMAEGVVFPFPSLPLNEGRTYGQPEVVLISLPQVATGLRLRLPGSFRRRGFQPDLLMPQGALLRRGRSDSFTSAKPEEDAVGNQCRIRQKGGIVSWRYFTLQ